MDTAYVAKMLGIKEEELGKWAMKMQLSGFLQKLGFQSLPVMNRMGK